MKALLFIMTYLTMAVCLAGNTANIRKGVMLYGYDPVSYFQKSGPTKGNDKLKAEVNGLTYLFSSEENRKAFVAEPKKYEPQYEGWCATAVANGYKFDIDPESYKVTDGRLFLFYKGWRGDAKKDWLKDESGFTKKADKNWSTVKTSEE